MADIRPFAALRPEKGLESRIAALPYDVYDRSEAKIKVTEEPLSFLAIDRAETQLSDDIAFNDPRVYARAKQMLDDDIQKGYFVQDKTPSYYIYSQTWNGRTQTGIVATASIDDYINGVIKKHENTREDKEQDRIMHVDTCSAQTGPIFLAYRENKTISDIVERVMAGDPVCDFVSDGDVRNRVYIISGNDDIRNIEEAFSSIDSVYIADGHHRCASAVKVGLKRRAERSRETSNNSNIKYESDYFLSVLFPENELRILDYNRVLKSMNGHSKEDVLTYLESKFEVSHPSKETARPERKGEFGFYIDGSWYLLTAKQSLLIDDPVEGLDVSILQNEVLGPLFGIKDPRTDPKIDFVGGIRGAGELEKRCREDAVCAFLMYPTSIQELFAVADAGRLMPPKSTWFEPKLLSGLFIHKI